MKSNTSLSSCIGAMVVALAAAGAAQGQIIEGNAAKARAAQLGIPVRVEHPDGKVVLLRRFVNGRPEYYTTTNSVAADTLCTDDTRVNVTNLVLDGSDVAIGIWDGGDVRLTHQEFGGRATQGDSSSLSDHATHVAGTIIASGIVASAKGMAPNGELICFDFDSDASEMLAQNLSLSNHSYGSVSGWEFNLFQDGRWAWAGHVGLSTTEDSWFGWYDDSGEVVDAIAYSKPGYLICKASGNDRNDGAPPGTEHWHWDGASFVLSTDTHPADGPYDCISTWGVAKNILTVGAVEDISGGWSQASNVVMSSFSSWGPTDDGRIKPDVVANGVGLNSSISTGNADYASYSGTSMATPNACGSAAILLDYWTQLHTESNNPPASRSATLKGLIIHSAREAGGADGPDYAFGWGLMDTLAAAVAIKHDRYKPDTIEELILPDPDPMSVDPDQIEKRLPGVRTGEKVRVSICWTDPAHSGLPEVLDPTTPVLVNDLDLRVIHNGTSTTYYPWKLNGGTPSNAATRVGDNNRDNVEVVEFTATLAGDYTIRVTHKGTLEDDEQEFTLLVNAVYEDVWLVPDNFASVSAALASPSVEDQSALLLDPGTYAENITISQPVTIYAAGGVATIGD